MLTTEKNFKLEDFEGPLDLILHLVKQKKLDLLEVSLVEIADQFLEYVNTLNLNLASEYLLIASQLVNIKSKYMKKMDLFLEPTVYDEVDSSELLAKLIEYKRYKKVSKELDKKFKEFPKFEKLDDEFEDFSLEIKNFNYEILGDESSKLKDTLLRVIKDFRDKKPIEFKMQMRKFSLEKRIIEIEEEINHKVKMLFSKMIKYDSINYIITTFLAILHLSAQSKIKIFQINNNQDIEINSITK